VTTPPCLLVLVLNSSLPVTVSVPPSNVSSWTSACAAASKSSPRRCSRCASTAAKSHAGSGAAARLTRRRTGADVVEEDAAEAAAASASREAQGSRSSCTGEALADGADEAPALALEVAVEVVIDGRDVTEREKDALGASDSDESAEDELAGFDETAVVVGTGT